MLRSFSVLSTFDVRNTGFDCFIMSIIDDGRSSDGDSNIMIADLLTIFLKPIFRSCAMLHMCLIELP